MYRSVEEVDMSKIIPQLVIETCACCHFIVHDDYRIYHCYKGQFEIRDACDCYVFEEIDSRCPLEDYNDL